MNALGEDIFRTRGRALKPLDAEVSRALEAADLALLGDEKGSVPTPLKRISSRHHAVARAIASGQDAKQISAIYNYSESRISILKSDPAFSELVAFYQAQDTEIVRDMNTQLAEVATDALEELRARLEDDPDKFSHGQLMEVVKLGADRTGHGPQTSQTNVNINVDLASRLEAARKRVNERRALVLDNDSGEVV